MDEVTFTLSAFKHGCTPEDIAHTWENAFNDRPRGNDQSVHVRAGADLSGQMIEMIGRRTETVWPFFQPT